MAVPRGSKIRNSRMRAASILVAIVFAGGLQAQTPRPASAVKERVIQAGDFIGLHHPYLGCTFGGNEHIPIAENGTILLPIIGEVKAVGVTPSQLVQDIESKLSQYLIHPEVKLTVVDESGKPLR